MFLLLNLSTVIYICISHCLCHESDILLGKRKKLEEQALGAFRSACLGLQDLSDWLAVVSRITNTLSRSVSDRMTEQTQQSPQSDKLARSKRNSRGSEEDSCSSLKNLRTTAESYVQLQAELLRLKASLGGNLFKTGKQKLDETGVALKVLQDRIKHLDALNRTSSEILRKLKVGSQGLSSQINAESSRALSLVKEVTSGQQDFFGFLQDTKDVALRHLQGVLEMKQDLTKTQELLQRGDFFQSIGQVLDRLLMPQATPSVTNGVLLRDAAEPHQEESDLLK